MTTENVTEFRMKILSNGQDMGTAKGTLEALRTYAKSLEPFGARINVLNSVNYAELETGDLYKK
ncbi:MAG TPA: hypothetical protein VJI12_02235 [archaeon]|nr:hypothetical protein [archaeon]